MDGFIRFVGNKQALGLLSSADGGQTVARTALRGLDIYYTDDGPVGACPIILVHGWGADSDEWIWHLDDLQRSFRVVTTDLRGHGHSGFEVFVDSTREMMTDLAALLDMLEIKSAVLVGHSMGANCLPLRCGASGELPCRRNHRPGLRHRARDHQICVADDPGVARIGYSE